MSDSLVTLITGGGGVGVTLINPGRVATPFWEPAAARRRLPSWPPMPSPTRTSGPTGQPPGVDVNTVTVRPVGASF
jgi:hypothetical protein